jgi:hypothetical protein
LCVSSEGVSLVSVAVLEDPLITRNEAKLRARVKRNEMPMNVVLAMARFPA